MSELEIRVSQMEAAEPVTVIHVAGDIDANTHAKLDERSEQVVAEGAKRVILDIGKVGYMSSAGFRSMHRLLRMLNEAGGPEKCLKVLNASDEVKRLMKAMGFDVEIPSYDDLNAALDSF